MAELDAKPIDLESYDNISPRARKKAYRAEIEAIKEWYKPKKYRKQNKHKDWKTDWKGFVECTYPWDGSDILTLIVYRLEVLRACLRHYGHHEGSEAEVEEMGEVIELGRKIIDDNYHEEAQNFSKEHCAHVINIHKRATEKFQLTGEQIGEIVKSEDDDYFSDDAIKAWCKEHDIKEKDITTSYCGRWDDQANHDKWLELLQAGNARREEDKKKFFSILAERLEFWWD